MDGHLVVTSEKSILEEVPVGNQILRFIKLTIFVLAYLNTSTNCLSIFESILFSPLICGQSYKHFMIINYNSRVIIWGIFKSGTTLES